MKTKSNLQSLCLIITYLIAVFYQNELGEVNEMVKLGPLLAVVVEFWCSTSRGRYGLL